MDREPQRSAVQRARWGIVGIALALAVASVLYRVTQSTEWTRNTAVLFVGVPTVIAIVLALTRPARSLTGTAIKATAIGLALSAIVFAEGMACILMAAPVFFLVAAGVAKAIEAIRDRGHGDAKALGLVILPFALLSLEGTTDATSFDRTGSVTAERVVEATADEVRAKLASAPAYYEEVPLLFRTGFPTPVSGRGSGLEVGDERHVDFTMGGFVVRVAERDPGRVVFARVEDTTPITDWVEVGDSVVTWTETAPGRTRIRWTMSYVRRLDPVWYFGPLERYGVSKAAGYLIDTVATP